MIVPCQSCHHAVPFEQPYAYHAGFSNLGFLYDDAGTSTLIWSSFDPAYEALVGQRHPWALDSEAQTTIEEALKPAPAGGAWRFSNPPRCPQCNHPIGESILRTIYYLVYPTSLHLDSEPTVLQFAKALRVQSPAA